MKIKGKVLDENNNPISGANIVYEANKGINTVSDSNGNFTIENDSIIPFSYFKISHVNHTPKFLKASDIELLPIVLPVDVSMLEEVFIKKEPKPKSTIIQNTKSTNKKPLILVGSIVLVGVGYLLIKKFL